MIYTNKTGLHPIYEKWLTSREEHKKLDSNTFSVTELLNDPYKIYLKRNFSENAECDIQSLIASASGTDWHAEMEKCAKELGYNTEDELTGNFITPKGRTITLYGRCDAWKDNELVDYKETKQAKFDKSISHEDEDWFSQMMIYVLLLRERTTIKRINILGKLKDVSAWREFVGKGNPYQGRMISWAYGSDFDDKDITNALTKILNTADSYLDLCEKLDVHSCSKENRLNNTVYKIYKLNEQGKKRVSLGDYDVPSDEHVKTAEKGCANFPTINAALDYFISHFDISTHCIDVVQGQNIGCYYCDLKSVCEYAKKLNENYEEVQE